MISSGVIGTGVGVVSARVISLLFLLLLGVVLLMAWLAGLAHDFPNDKGMKFSNTKIRTLVRQLDIESPNACTLEEVTRKRDLAFQDYYNNMKKKDEAFRITFLETKAAHIALETDSDASKVLLQLRDREKMRKSNRHIDWWTLEKHKGAGVTTISVEDDQGIDRDITDHFGIESACLLEFEKKYRQTEQTPSMQEPWLSILGFNGKTRGAKIS